MPIAENQGCIVAGIDTLFSSSVSEKLLHTVLEDECRYRTLLLASQTDVAPTHLVARVEDGFVSALGTARMMKGEGLLRDTGMRYIPKSNFPKILRQLAIQTEDVSVSKYWASCMHCTEDGRVRAVITHDPWRHFAVAQDFGK